VTVTEPAAMELSPPPQADKVSAATAANVMPLVQAFFKPT